MTPTLAAVLAAVAVSTWTGARLVQRHGGPRRFVAAVLHPRPVTAPAPPAPAEVRFIEPPAPAAVRHLADRVARLEVDHRFLLDAVALLGAHIHEIDQGRAAPIPPELAEAITAATDAVQALERTEQLTAVRPR